MDYRRRNYTRAGNYRIGDATRRVSAVAATQRRDAASSHPYSSFSPKSATSSNSSDLSSPLLDQEQPQPRPPASGAPPLRQRLGGAQARPNQVPLGAQLCDAACFGTGVKWHPCGYEDPGAKAVRQSRIEDEDMRWEWAEDGGFPSGFSLPGWWIAFQQWAGFNPFWALLNDIILPLQVEKISPSGKFAQLGFVNAAQMFQAFGEAAFGVICDRTPDNRFGRRRLHVGLAAVPNLLAVLMMWYSLDPGLSETAAVYFLAGGVALQAIISTWSGAAMSAQLVECTPEHQRGVAGSWSGVFDSMENFAEQGLTVLVGWSVLTFDGTYAFSCVMFIIGPIANIVSYSRRPWFYPEPPTPRNLREGGAGREGQGGKDEGGSSSCSCLVRAWQVVKRELIGFIKPMQHKPFLYLVLYQSFNSIDFGGFYLYFLQDYVEPDFNVFGVHISDNAVVAMAFLQSVRSFIRLGANVMGPFVEAKIGRMPNILITQTLLPAFSASKAFTNDFTVIFVINSIEGIMDGLGNPSMQALQADVLPSAEDFARDANLMNVPGDLIGALCPLFTGHMLGVFQQNKAERRKAYTWFFLLSAITGIIPMFFFWLIYKLPKPKEEQTHVGAEAAIQRWDDYRKQMAADERRL